MIFRQSVHCLPWMIKICELNELYFSSKNWFFTNLHTRNLANGMWHLSTPKGETHFLLLELVTKGRETTVKDHQLSSSYPHIQLECFV